MPRNAPTDRLRDADVLVRRRAAGALGGAADPEAAALAVTALGDVSEQVRTAAAESLAELAGRGLAPAEAITPLAAALKDVAPAVRAAAAHALAVLAGQSIMSPAAIGPLIAALEDEEAAARRWATAALGRLGRLGPSARRSVWAALSNKALGDGDFEVRKRAAEALAGLTEAPPAPAPDRAAQLRKALCELPAERAVEELVLLGRRLGGPPLRRSSWLLVARALGDAHSGELVARILASATSREHALRALRLSRLARANRAPRARAAAQRGPDTAQQEHTIRPRDSFFSEEEQAGDYELEYHTSYSLMPSILGDASRDRLRVPGILPVSALQAAADECTHRALHPRPPVQFTALRARTDDATYARLVKLVRGPQAPAADGETTALAERLGVPERAGDFSGRIRPVLTQPAEVALLCFLEELRHQAIDAEIDWASVTPQLIEELSRPPPGDEVRLSGLLRAVLHAILRAPRAQLLPLLRALPKAHAEYTPLLLWPQLRAGDATPAAAAVVHVGYGSTLALHHVRRSFDDIREARRIELPQPWHGWGRQEGLLPDLLLSGAGTLRRMDYPSFRVVVRPSISIVPPELLAELLELCENLLWKHQLLATGTFDLVLTKLFEDAASNAYRRLPDEARRALTRTLEEHAIAYVVLKTAVLADEPIKIRRKHVRGLAARKNTLEEELPASFAELRRTKGHDLSREGLCHALLGELHEKWTDDPALAAALKEGLIAVLRSVAATYRQGDLDPGTDTEEPALRAVRVSQFLQARLVDAPFEVAAALGLDQGLPRLSGGRLPEAELRYRRVMRRLSGSVRTVSGAEERNIECLPISKAAALERSLLGADCSSSYVPMRALSPHHVYYGIFEGGRPRPGYMTVYEAWAELPGGKRAAVLCLETINVPQGAPDAALQDIVRIFEAIAAARGLHPGLVLITGIGTWNYQSGPLLEQSRRFRRGTPVTLHPADPVTWKLYEAIAREARLYSAFNEAKAGAFRMLAPFDPDLDFVQPENEEEAARIRASGPRQLIVTARDESGPIGFISGWPEIL